MKSWRLNHHWYTLGRCSCCKRAVMRTQLNWTKWRIHVVVYWGLWISTSTMATAHLGTLNAFNSAEEPITYYLEHVQLFFTANSVNEGKEVPTFLSTVGPATYAILRDLFAPALPSSVPLMDIFERLKKQESHYCWALPLSQRGSTPRRDHHWVLLRPIDGGRWKEHTLWQRTGIVNQKDSRTKSFCQISLSATLF